MGFLTIRLHCDGVISLIWKVLDARDPMGTRSKHIEDYMRKEKGFKQLVFVLNKCDLVPNWSTAGWVATLSKVCPTIAFHASVTNSYGLSFFGFSLAFIFVVFLPVAGFFWH